MAFQEISLWAATAPELESFVGRPLEERADVVVIGGGYTGLSAALRLAKLGARVTVLEQESIGWGASSRNGGMVLTGHKHGIGEMTQTFGLTRARELWNASLAALDTIPSWHSTKRSSASSAHPPANTGVKRAGSGIMARR